MAMERQNSLVQPLRLDTAGLKNQEESTEANRRFVPAALPGFPDGISRHEQKSTSMARIFTNDYDLQIARLA